MPPDKYRILDDPDLINSLETFFRKSSHFSRAIYTIIVILLIFTAFAMALVRIPVYVESRGIIRPSAEVVRVLAPVPGIVKDICAHENQHIQKGQPVILFEAEKEKLHDTLNASELNETRLMISDLKQILNSSVHPGFLTEKYKIEYRIYKEQTGNLDLRLKLAEADKDRDARLISENYISQKEYDETVFKLEALRTEKSQVKSRMERQWSNELTELTSRESFLMKQQSETRYFIEKSVINAPFSGTIQGIRNIYRGQYCAAGTVMCKLVPDTSLVAELFIPSRDIGLINTGQAVRLLIDAFDFRYWGAVETSCTSISEDVEINGNQAVFRVICRLQPDQELSYKTKHVRPGKGMTLTARFLLTEKNAWQLVSDRFFMLTR